MALFYADASALVKLVRDEPESAALRTYIEDADLVSCGLVLAEIPRAVRRAAADDPGLPLDLLLRRAAELIEAIALLPVDNALLAAAGATISASSSCRRQSWLRPSSARSTRS